MTNTNIDKEKIELNEINKLRRSIGVREIVIKKVKCLKCSVEITIRSCYICHKCKKLNEFIYYDDVYERQRIFNFNCKDKRYQEKTHHYVLGGL